MSYKQISTNVSWIPDMIDFLFLETFLKQFYEYINFILNSSKFI